MKLLISDHRIYEFQVEEEHLRRLQAVSPEVEVSLARTEEEALEMIQHVEVHFGGLSPEVFRRAKQLHWVQTSSAGIDSLLFSEMVESDVILTNASGAYDVPIAEHGFALMLALSRDLKGLMQDQRNKDWMNREGRMRYSGGEVTGWTVGIIGLGHIGLEVARKAHGFGMHVLAVDPTPRERPDFVRRIWEPEEIGAMLEQSDVVVISAPITPKTRGLIGESELRRMKSTAYLINLSRGQIVSEAALVRALKEGVIAGAGLDVMEREPLPPDSELWEMDQVLITPHVAGISEQANRKIWEICCDNLRRYLTDAPLQNVVDKRRGY